MNNKIELLAPAGDLERAKVAIMYGANAVYIGGKKFSLRSRASNFEIEDIKQAVIFANKYNAHIHVTINMIPHSDDFEGLKEYLIQLESVGVTAIIVASLTIVKVAKLVAPKLEVHLSTQMTSTNHMCCEFYEQYKIDRLVLARECNLKQIDSVCSNSKLPIEAFIHGAMCTNYSGRCTLSNAMTLRDANRGGCAQSCRWKYNLYINKEIVNDDKSLFSMSSKDLLAFLYIYDMMKSNVASLKIEGRMKSAYYIATVVKTYRDLIDEIALTQKPLDDFRIAYYQNEFSKAENRPTCFGFLDHEPNDKDHLYGINGAGVTHDFLAVVMDYDVKLKLATIQVRNHFVKGDQMEVFGPNITNEVFVVDDILDEKLNFIEVCNKPMQIVRLNIPFKVEVGDMIRKR